MVEDHLKAVKKEKKKKRKSLKAETQAQVAGTDVNGSLEPQRATPPARESKKKSKKNGAKNAQEEGVMMKKRKREGDTAGALEAAAPAQQAPKCEDPESPTAWETDSMKKKRKKQDKRDKQKIDEQEEAPAAEQPPSEPVKKKRKKEKGLEGKENTIGQVDLSPTIAGKDVDMQAPSSAPPALESTAPLTECASAKEKKKKKKKKKSKCDDGDAGPVAAVASAAEAPMADADMKPAPVAAAAQEVEGELGGADEDAAGEEWQEEVQEQEQPVDRFFRRVKSEEWLGKKGSMKNSYEATFGNTGWGAKAQQVLGATRGKGFRHEKTKKKRGSYMGGKIDSSARTSFKYDSD